VDIASRVDWVYDFALPPLILHALFNGDTNPLVRWIAIRPSNSFTVLDTHDGIGVIDVGADAAGNPGLLEPSEIHHLVESVHRFSNGQSQKATGAAANNLDLYQLNCTYLNALGSNETLYLIARAVQFFVPGIPQVYYVGLLGGQNDMELLSRSGVGRDINRHHYTPAEVSAALDSPMVKRLLELIRIRNSHPAFNGKFIAESPSGSLLIMGWTLDDHWIRLRVDFSLPRATIDQSIDETGRYTTIQIG
jgi:sucrose phosphorylase